MTDTSRLALPIACAPDLFLKDMQENIRGFTRPITSAIAADIIGINQTFLVTAYGAFEPQPIIEVVRRSNTPDKAYEIIPFTDLPGPLQDQVGAGIVRFQCSGLNFKALQWAADRFAQQAGEAFYFQTLVTPDAVFLSMDDFIDTIFDQVHAGGTHQKALNDAMLLYLPRSFESQHEIIEDMPFLSEILELVNSLHPVPDPDDWNVMKPLGLDVRALVAS